jgi:hypothetical protein
LFAVVSLPYWYPYWSAFIFRAQFPGATPAYRDIYSLPGALSTSPSPLVTVSKRLPASSSGPQWSENVYHERVMVAPVRPGSGEAASAGGSTPRAYDVRVSEAGSRLTLQLPAQISDADLEAIARDKAQAWKERQRARQVHVTGYRRGGEVEVHIQPVR